MQDPECSNGGAVRSCAGDCSMPSDSRVSVVIAVFNGDSYLSEAIHSALGQTLAPYEVIVVDDGSTDNTPDVAASFGSAIRYDRQLHKGVSATLNRGIQLARGELLAFLDADDVWLPDKLQKQIAVLQAQPEIDLVFGYSRFFASPDFDENAVRRLRIPDQPQPAFIKSAMLIRRASFLRVGFFDTAWQVGDFVDWYAKSMEAGLKAHLLPDVVYKRRVHACNMTITERSSQGNYVRILKAALDRRRSGACPQFNADSQNE
jgi:glycosyltransferase involved in cell wall biosynthesis